MEYSKGELVFYIFSENGKTELSTGKIEKKLGCEQDRLYRVSSCDYILHESIVSNSPRELGQKIINFVKLTKEEKQSLIKKLKLLTEKQNGKDSLYGTGNE